MIDGTATPNETPGLVAASDPTPNERCTPGSSFMDELTEEQRETLGQIAIGFDGGHNEHRLAMLAERGLIVGYRETLDGRPPVEVVRWDVPTWAHIEWARWCANQPDDEEPAPA